MTRRLLGGSGIVNAVHGRRDGRRPDPRLALHLHAALAEFDFGQREHLFILFAIPYVVLRWLRWEERTVRAPLAVVIGLAAGLLASLKPHFLLVMLAPELPWLARHRRPSRLFTAETMTAAAFVLVYAAHFAFLPATMRDAFFHRWMPFIAAGYGAYDVPLTDLLRNRRLLAALATASLPLLLHRREPSPAWRFALPLSTMTLTPRSCSSCSTRDGATTRCQRPGCATLLGLLLLAELGDLGGRLGVAPVAKPLAAAALAYPSCFARCRYAADLRGRAPAAGVSRPSCGSQAVRSGRRDPLPRHQRSARSTPPSSSSAQARIPLLWERLATAHGVSERRRARRAAVSLSRAGRHAARGTTLLRTSHKTCGTSLRGGLHPVEHDARVTSGFTVLGGWKPRLDP